jgi:hypothetical protein
MNDFGGSWRRASGYGGSQVSVVNFGSTLTLPSLTGLIAHWRAEDSVVGGGNVTSVPGASGTTYTLTNTNTVPYNATGINGKPAWDFLAANNALLKVSSFGVGTGVNLSVFAVMQMKTATASNGGLAAYGEPGGTDFSSAGSSLMLGRNSTNNQVVTYRGGGSRATQSISLSTTSRIGSIISGANNIIYLNNSPSGTSTGSSVAYVDGGLFVIGGRVTGGAVDTTSPWEGPVAEIVVCAAALSSTERDNLDAYFVARGF